jgi:hypothetical protein
MEDNNNTPTQEQQDPRLIQPEIIGELRKNKIGKPILVIELFLLFGIVFTSLPFINEMLNDENSKLYQLINGKPQSVVTTTTIKNDVQGEFYDGSKLTQLQSGIAMRYDDIVIKDIELRAGVLKCTIYAYTGIVDLDKENYFLEISSSSGNVLGAIKLYGKYDNVEQEVELETNSVAFNSSYGYQGRIVEMTDDDYPDITFESVDTKGYATLVCTKNTRTISYRFQNNFLVSMIDEDHQTTREKSTDDYINLLAAAKEKASNLGTSIASVEEVEDGFIFKASIDYDKKYEIPSTVVDYNYYPQNTLAKKIKYTQVGKGYDCK